MMGPAPRGLGMIHGNSPGVMIRFTIMSWHPSSTRSGGRIWESSCILVQRVGRKTGERMGYFLTAFKFKAGFFHSGLVLFVKKSFGNCGSL